MDLRNYFPKKQLTSESVENTNNINVSAGVSTDSTVTVTIATTSASASASTSYTQSRSTSGCGSNWFKGYKLDLKWLLSHYNFLQKSVQSEGTRNRNVVCCTICKEFKYEAAKFSKNGIVPLAVGIRVDGVQKLQRIIDHILSRAHLAAFEVKKASELWKQQSDKHPWVKTLKKHRAGVVNDLIALCMDVYNDSLLETPTARTWPARSLTSMRTQSIQAQLNDANDWEVQLDDFQPPASALHYRDPVVYAEMCHIIGDLERQKISESFKSAICISLQIDGSVDRSNQDLKYVVARYISKDAPSIIENRFIGAIQPEKRGAEGLLEATKRACESVNLPIELLVGVTTDGESANTGRERGLWKLLENHVEHKLMTVWCFCHRSDLAMESALETVPELKMWLANATAVGRYFRTSPSKLKEMQQIFTEHRSFPAYFEVRFAEHVNNLLTAILHNLPGCIALWQKLSNDECTDKKDKNVAKGMLKIWDAPNSQQLVQTSVMADVTRILKELQQNLQKGNLILPDVITVKNNALRKLNLMLRGPFPGGLEDKLLSNNSDSNSQNTEDGDLNVESYRKRRKVNNSFVTTGTRSWPAVRTEIINSFINFLDERMNIEENELIKGCSSLLLSKSAKEMIDNGRTVIESIFGKDKVCEFASNVCDCWPAMQDVEDLDISDTDTGLKLSYKLRKLIPVTTGILQKLLGSFYIVSPHSMTVEKVISHANQIKSIHRMSTSDETMNSRMFISLNGVGTALYDPRPAVAEFLQKKERRYREPDLSLYSERDFVRKYFRKTSEL